MQKIYHIKPTAKSKPMERFAVGPIPPVHFSHIKYLDALEAETLVKGGLPVNQAIQPHPVKEGVYVLGEYLSDTFLPMLLLTEDQLEDIGEHAPQDMDKWEADDWVVVPYDTVHVETRL